MIKNYSNVCVQIRLNPFLPLGQGHFIYLNVGRGLHEGVNHLLADGAVDNVACKTDELISDGEVEIGRLR